MRGQAWMMPVGSVRHTHLKHGDCDILRNVLGAIRGLNLLHEGLHLQWVCCPRHNVHVPRDVTSLELLALHPEGPFVSLWVVPVCNNAISHAPLQARPPERISTMQGKTLMNQCNQAIQSSVRCPAFRVRALVDTYSVMATYVMQATQIF